MTLRLGGVIFGDVLTEVYGYRRSRRVVWVGFGAVAMASLTFFLCDLAPRLEHQQAFLLILGSARWCWPRTPCSRSPSRRCPRP